MDVIDAIIEQTTNTALLEDPRPRHEPYLRNGLLMTLRISPDRSAPLARKPVLPVEGGAPHPLHRASARTAAGEAYSMRRTAPGGNGGRVARLRYPRASGNG